MSTTKVKELLDAGIHFGHRASRWNPKMRAYIYGRHQLIHIIDVRETLRGLLRSQRYLTRVASQNSLILFVGTKRQAAETVQREAERSRMPYVNQRWLGGTLTNFRTVRSRLRRLEELEAIEASGELATYSKKIQASILRERRKMHRNLDGIRHMDRLPQALVIIDPRREHLAIKEARKLDIPTIALIDTDCDPDLVDLPIPGNDDSIRSIEVVLRELADAVLLGRASVPEKPADQPALAPPQVKTASPPTDAAAKVRSSAKATPAPASPEMPVTPEVPADQA